MINLMSYYFFGPWDCYANHHSPLQRSSFGDQNFNINSAFNMLTTTYQVPSNKINIGMCFHGRSQTGASNIFQTTNCGEDKTTFAVDAGSPTYYNIVDKYNLFNYYWDNTAQVPYLVGKTGSSADGTFVSYDNKKSIGIKAQYINDNNARGAIVWELTGDYVESAPGSGIVSETPLLDTLNSVFCTTTNMKTNQKIEFDLYPNPANDFVGIEINEQTLNTLSIYDSKGSLVLTQSVHSGYNDINIKQLSQGIFIIRLQSKDFSYFKKIIKL